LYPKSSLVSRYFYHRMATTASFVANLPPLPKVEGTEPDRCVLDLFRTAIAKRVADALPPLTVEQVYNGVDYGKKGVDFTVALPRFRLPGKVDELASKVLSTVSDSSSVSLSNTRW
jgi:arginyl-tRNA synthetase